MNSDFFLSFFIFIFSNLLALGNAFVWARALRNFQKRPILGTIFETSTLFFAEIILIETMGGMLGKLSFFSTALAILILFAVTLFYFHKKILADLKQNHVHHSKTDIPWLGMFFFLSVPVVIVILRLFHSTLQIPLDYDSVTYHLPFAVEWLKNGNLWHIFYNPFLGPVGYYPGNFELLLLWLIFPFGKDYFVNFINYPLLILSGLVLYQICKNEGMGKTSTLFAIAMVLSQPIIFILLGSQLVELFIVFGFLMTFYFLREYQKKQRLASIIFMGLAAGLLIGTKFTGILYAGPFLFSACWNLLVYWKKQKKLPAFAKKILLLALTIFITSGFWYIRNWMDIGSPLYPVEIPFITHLPKIQNAQQNPLPFDTSLAVNIKTAEQFNEFLFYFVKRTGGQWLLILLVIGLGLKETITTLLLKKSDKKPYLSLLFIIGSVVYFLLYWFLPYTGDPNVMIHNIRFALPFVIFSFFTVCYLLEKIKTPWFAYGLAAIAAFFYNLNFTYFKSHQNPLFNDFINIDGLFIKEHLGLFIFSLGVLGIIAWFFSILFSSKKLYLKGTSMILVLSITGLYFWQTLPLREELRIQTYIRWHQGDTNSLQWIEAAEWLNHNINKAKIGLTGFTYSYALYGRNFERDIEYININNCGNCKTSNYVKTGRDSRDEANYENWYSNLLTQKIDYIIIDKKTFNDIVEYNWAQNHKDTFKEVHQNNLVSIFSIAH